MSKRRRAAHRRRTANRQRRQRRRRIARRPTGQKAGSGPRRATTRRSAPIFRSALERITDSAFQHLLHAKQVISLFMIAYGIVHSDRLGIAAVGTAMARAFGTKPKHGIKQVDRYLSNGKLDMRTLFQGFVPFVVGQRSSIFVTLDWTEFDKDDHTTLSIAHVTPKGRAMPLVWLTVRKSELKGRQRAYEKEALRMFKDAVPSNVDVVVLADRGLATSSCTATSTRPSGSTS